MPIQTVPSRAQKWTRPPPGFLPGDERWTARSKPRGNGCGTTPEAAKTAPAMKLA